jgi:hypothetical protein
VEFSQPGSKSEEMYYISVVPTDATPSSIANNYRSAVLMV